LRFLQLNFITFDVGAGIMAQATRDSLQAPVRFLGCLLLALAIGTTVKREATGGVDAFHVTSVRQTPQRSSSFSSSHYMTASSETSAASVEALKSELLRASPLSSGDVDVATLVQQLEQAGEREGVGQGGSISGLLSGEWELVAASEDVTRSSPFFWAFRAAFPENSDQVYEFTDSIPEPLKRVGPAFQTIDWNPTVGTGRLVSRVKVATLGGMATSIMTTRTVIQGSSGLDGLRVKVETTKPEDSTVLQTLLGSALGSVVSENLPAFPSGDALERVKPGSSVVEMRNTFVDEEMRISRYRETDYFVWKRRQFASYDFL
jgi:hypothetical protein